jgi:hypothetical protein
MLELELLVVEHGRAWFRPVERSSAALAQHDVREREASTPSEGRTERLVADAWLAAVMPLSAS